MSSAGLVLDLIFSFEYCICSSLRSRVHHSNLCELYISFGFSFSFIGCCRDLEKLNHLVIGFPFLWFGEVYIEWFWSCSTDKAHVLLCLCAALGDRRGRSDLFGRERELWIRVESVFLAQADSPHVSTMACTLPGIPISYICCIGFKIFLKKRNLYDMSNPFLR